MEGKPKILSFDIVLPLILAVFMAAIIATCVLQFNENKAKHRGLPHRDTLSKACVRMLNELDSLNCIGAKNGHYVVGSDTIEISSIRILIYQKQK